MEGFPILAPQPRTQGAVFLWCGAAASVPAEFLVTNSDPIAPWPTRSHADTRSPGVLGKETHPDHVTSCDRWKVFGVLVVVMLIFSPLALLSPSH